jgi:hypothetical protein
MKLIIILLLITFSFSQTQEYALKDGTKLKGTVLSESKTDVVVQTSFGAVTIKKSDLILKEFNIKMLSGDVFRGTKQTETETDIHLLTKIGLLKLTKQNIASIEEVGKVSSTGYVHKKNSRSFFGFLGNSTSGKDTDFSLGEEQLIDLFFDPTAYTLNQSTLYLSGLSFGFGVTDKLQVSAKWLNFLWGDMNIRPKFQVFKIGNWEKQQALSIGGHYHTRWMPNKYEWKSGSLEVPIYTGEYKYGSDCPDEFYYNSCWEQTAPKTYETKYWGGYFLAHENINYEIEENNEPSDYDSDELTTYNSEPRYDIEQNSEDYFEFTEMVELFGAYTYSSARKGLKGRVSHTLGGNVQLVQMDETKYFYRAYYGLDVDISPKLKMISEVFYDPNYLEFWQWIDNQDNYCYDDCLMDEPMDKPKNSPIHLDFGFIYAVNESFRFGVHFQKPFVAFYWKI